MDGEWISKRDLLKECGISYGQLYRWKREGLIPEAWFVKRSVPSGQETFLPRQQSIERIRMILGSRGRLSQASLRRELGPAEGQTYRSTLLIRLPGVTRPLIQIAALTGAKEFTYTQALCAMIAASMLESYPAAMPDEQLRSLLKNLLTWAEQSDSFRRSSGALALLSTLHGALVLWLDRPCAIEPPVGTKVACILSLDEIPERFNRPLALLAQENIQERK